MSCKFINWTIFSGREFNLLKLRSKVCNCIWFTKASFSILIIHLLDKLQEILSVAQPIDTILSLLSTTGVCAKLLPKSSVLKNHINNNTILTIANVHSVPNKYFFPCFWKWFLALFMCLNKWYTSFIFCQTNMNKKDSRVDYIQKKNPVKFWGTFL